MASPVSARLSLQSPQTIAFVRREGAGAFVRRFVYFSLLREPSTVVFRVCCGTVFCGHLVGHIYRCIYSLSGSSQQRPHISVSAGPFSAAQNHNSTQTASIFVCGDSFIQALTAKHRMSIPSPVTRSHARYTIHSSGHGLSSYVSGWLLQQERLSNPGGLRWSPQLVPIAHTSHQSRLVIVEQSQSLCICAKLQLRHCTYAPSLQSDSKCMQLSL